MRIAPGLAELLSGTTRLRNKEDPLLTKVPVSFEAHPRYYSRFQRAFFEICCKAPVTTGMPGSAGPPMMALGKKLFIEAPWR